MKILLCICSVLTLLSCSTPKGIAQGQKEEPGYLIKKIKSKNSWHIIYAQKQDSLYKTAKFINEDDRVYNSLFPIRDGLMVCHKK